MRARTLASILVVISLAVLILRFVRHVHAQPSVPSGFVVVDSTGKQLGPVIGVQAQGTGNLTTAALRSQGQWLPVDVQRTSFFSGTEALFYLSSDCTGQPYSQSGSGPWVTTVQIGTPALLYVESGPHQSITAESFLGGDGVTCNAAPTPLPDAVPVASNNVLSTFTPPFSVVAVTPSNSQ